jgi:predicted enzyme related to lactoylglutathione lyase
MGVERSDTGARLWVGRFDAIIIDVRNLAVGARFWSKVLGVPITSEEGQYLRLGRQGGGPRVILQEVPERKTAKNRVHLDFRVSDVQAALARVEELGGKKIDEDLSDGSVVVVDLDGNELCLVKEISGTPGPGS